MADKPQIDPNTGEVVQEHGDVQIDPNTGEVIQHQPTVAERAFGTAKDLGKGVLESVGGTLDTLGAPVGWAAKKAGLVSETPEERQQQEQLFKPANTTQAVGAGLGDALQAMVPVERAIPLAKSAGGAIGRFVEPVTSKISEFNQAWNPLPLRSRAVKAMQTIENEARDVPVNMTKTEPKVSEYLQHIDTGGERSGPVMGKLARRMGDLEQGPILYPEARQFYKNIGRESESPGFLRRAMEPRGMADTRRVVGGAGQALKTDIFNSLPEQRAEQLRSAMQEYSSNAKLRTLGKYATAAAAAEAARRSGLIGHVASKVLGQ